MKYRIAFTCSVLSLWFTMGCTSGTADGNEPPEKTVLVHSDENVSAAELVTWCSNEDNQLSKSKTISEMCYKVLFLPPENMAYMELKTGGSDFETFKKVSDSFKDLSYFNFRLEVNNGSGELLKYNLRSAAQYEQRIKYVSFRMEKDFYLLQGNDTIYPGLYHFERTFEVVPYLTVMMAFDNRKFNKEREFTLVYDDKLFEKGLIKFNYREKQLVDIPKVVQL